MSDEIEDRKTWHRILRKIHKNADVGKGATLTKKEVNLLAAMFEEGVDG